MKSKLSQSRRFCAFLSGAIWFRLIEMEEGPTTLGSTIHCSGILDYIKMEKLRGTHAFLAINSWTAEVMWSGGSNSCYQDELCGGFNEKSPIGEKHILMFYTPLVCCIERFWRGWLDARGGSLRWVLWFQIISHARLSFSSCKVCA